MCLYQQATDVPNTVMTAMMTNESLGKFISLQKSFESVSDAGTAETAECKGLREGMQKNIPKRDQTAGVAK